MSVAVRGARAADHERIGELTVGAFVSGGMSAASPYAATLLDVRGRERASVMLAAVDDTTGEVVGAVAFVRAGSPLAEVSHDDEASFRMLAVDPRRQGHGVGTALVRACLARAREAGAPAVAISVAADSVGARRMYERLGFARLPDRDRQIDDGPLLLGYGIRV